MGVLCLSLFCYALLCVHSSFANISNRKRKLVDTNSMWLFFIVQVFGLQCVIVVFPDHTNLLLFMVLL